MRTRRGLTLLYGCSLLFLAAMLESGSSLAREPSPGAFRAVVIPDAVRHSMGRVWDANNAHWDELANVATLTQMVSSEVRTQREYLGCLYGRVDRDTLWVDGWVVANHLKQLQFAATGDCENVPGLVGTWHTHPFRADSTGQALKERKLSKMDLRTFERGQDLLIVAVWDVDSLDAATRGRAGTLRHPRIVVR